MGKGKDFFSFSFLLEPQVNLLFEDFLVQHLNLPQLCILFFSFYFVLASILA